LYTASATLGIVPHRAEPPPDRMIPELPMTCNNSFRELAEQCLFEPAIEAKLEVTRRLEDFLVEVSPDFSCTEPPRPAHEVRFPDRPRLVEPRLLKRRSLHTDAGRVAFLHAVAHIEFTAILLACDMAYRFRGLPDDFYRDWLGIAIEEARHFAAVRQRLHALGAEYGDLPAHRGLWELAEHTAGDVLHRLALVPRFMEARGLDVTPSMIEKLRELDDAASVAVLELILREEIGHVAAGTRWFRHIARLRGVNAEEVYFDLIGQYIKGGVRGPFNLPARRLAGFSEGELERLERLDGSPS
jgi:uncharacterized ferritin-like protein (DUF455 family)